MEHRGAVVASSSSGGLLGGASLGLVEALFHLAYQGAPDWLGPFYALALYGLLGAGFGTVAGMALAVLPGVSSAHRPLAFGLGAVGALAPMGGFTSYYLANKILFAERGVPGAATVALLALLAVVVVGVVAGARTLGAPSLGRATGLWVFLLGVTGMAALLGAPNDPRTRLGRGAAVPEDLKDAPNVLFLTIDTLRADHLGAYGAPGAPTPVMDGLAADGVLFEQASAHASWTRSSFASLWTSRLPSAHKADRKASLLSPELVLLSEVLQARGVVTGNLVNNINVTATFGFDQGYDVFLYEAPAYPFGATESVFALTFYKVVHKLREKLGGWKRVERYYQPAEVVLADARAFIEANRDSRWMLGVHLMEPHDPYFEHPYLRDDGAARFNGVGFARAEVERPSLEQADALRALYVDEIRHLDRQLAPFVAWLKASGIYDRTLIVLTSDHGEEFGEHGGFWHGTTLYEEQIHVPLILKLPRQELAGTRVPWQVRLIDVAPTVTAVMGIPPDPSWAGRDLIADLRDERAEQEAAARAREEARATVAALAERDDAGRLEEEERAALLAAQRLLELPPATPCAERAHPRDRSVVAEQDFEGNVLGAVRMRGFKLIRANEGNPRGLPQRALYDLVADPGERRELLGGGGSVCERDPDRWAQELEALLDEEIRRAVHGAVEAQDVEMDAGAVCNLCALGYMEGPQCDGC